MITTRDIKVFIFSILFSTLCYALFDQPIKEAEAQGGMPPMGAPGMAPPGGGRDICREHAIIAGEKHDNIYELTQTHARLAGEKHDAIFELIQAHINGAIENHNLTRERIQGHINGAIENHNRTYDATINHATIAGEKHDAILAKLDELLSR